MRSVFEANIPPDTIHRVLIYGAGHRGIMAARALRESRSGLAQVGFLDDDQEKVGRRLLGLPVEGPGVDAEVVARRLRASGLVVALPDEEASKVESVVEMLGGAELALYEWSMALRPLDASRSGREDQERAGA
jgi:FlaA1/EpsC-like NDP-sugar epimerase